MMSPTCSASKNCLIKMHTQPEMVEAAFERVCTFYLDANERLFDAAGDTMEAFFFGNDLGTQRGLMIGPEQLERFVFPWVRRLSGRAHERGYQVILHSCGSVHQIIDRFVEAGIQCLHPLQARAEGMECRVTGTRLQEVDLIPRRDRYTGTPGARHAG